MLGDKDFIDRLYYVLSIITFWSCVDAIYILGKIEFTMAKYLKVKLTRCPSSGKLLHKAALISLLVE